MKPINVRKYSDLIELDVDGWGYGDFYLGFNHEKEFFLHEQKVGESVAQQFKIPARVLRHFIKKLTEDQK